MHCFCVIAQVSQKFDASLKNYLDAQFHSYADLIVNITFSSN
jgi:hypothetical protein